MNSALLWLVGIAAIGLLMAGVTIPFIGETNTQDQPQGCALLSKAPYIGSPLCAAYQKLSSIAFAMEIIFIIALLLLAWKVLLP